MVEVPPKAYQPIENYGIIGDLYTVALVLRFTNSAMVFRARGLLK